MGRVPQRTLYTLEAQGLSGLEFSYFAASKVLVVVSDNVKALGLYTYVHKTTKTNAQTTLRTTFFVTKLTPAGPKVFFAMSKRCDFGIDDATAAPPWA